MNKRECVDSPFIEQITSNDHKVDVTVQGIVDDIPECSTEVIKTLAHTVLFVAEMGVRYMDKRSSHNSLRPELRWPCHQGANGSRDQYQGGNAENQYIPARILAAGGIGNRDRYG